MIQHVELGSRARVEGTRDETEKGEENYVGPHCIRNSTPLLPRVLSQHSVVSLGIIADISVIFVVVGIFFDNGKTTGVRVRVGTHVNTTVVAEMTAIVTALPTTVSANAVSETGGGAATG